jgi:hypothetical protein
MKYLFYTFAWILGATGVIMSGIGGYVVYKSNSLSETQIIAKSDVISPIPENENGSVLAAIDENPTPSEGIEAVYELDDARAVIVANFLERYKSPMEPYDYYGAELVKIADKYGIDFRLLPAIAMQESNLCKATNPDAPGNCLGFGIHKRGTLDFDNYLAGFDRAGRELKERYIDIGLDTPEKIMTKYTPSSNGSWAESVKQWMAEMRYDDRDKGRTLKVDENVLELANPEI